MRLTKLEVHGFKSFGQKAVLDFTTPITAVVGPNGSGKSNVVEAFRFVLGEQSVKSMRGKRGEDLIFNGAAGGSRLNRASVKVFFDNRDRFFDLDFDEVVIERVVHRDSLNEYFINGSKVRLKDVHELLSKGNIGASGHHIISQGEADRILSASPKERKVMIEDALGLRVYQLKKKESAKKLEKTEENISSVESLRREIAPHMRFLKKQIEKIEKVREMRVEIKERFVEYFKREDLYLRIEKNAILALKTPVVQKESLLIDQVERLNTQLSKEKEGSVEKTNEEYADTLRKIEEERNSLLRDIGRLEGEITSQKRLIEREEGAKRENISIPLQELRLILDDITNFLALARNGSVDNVGGIEEKVKEFWGRFGTEQDDSLISSLSESLIEFEKKRAHLEVTMKDVQEKEDVLRKSEEESRQKERESQRGVVDLQQKVFDIEKELFGVKRQLEQFSYRENMLVSSQEKFESDQKEAPHLIGKEAVFEGVEVEGVSRDTVMSEGRDAQVDRRQVIERLKLRIEDAGGGGVDETISEYKEVVERDEFLLRELEDLKTSAVNLATLITELDGRIQKEFKEGLQKIDKKFEEFFQTMFGGGSAGVSIVREKVVEEDGEGEIVSGVDVSISLPKKKVKSLMMLSGGERALASTALLFAMSQVTPPPFIVLDETDAALDEANSERYGEMVQNLSQHSELILITHNRTTMAQAGVLYGVTMTGAGLSRLLSIKFEEANAIAK
jgi:chromosome segregation ATPase